MGTYADMRARIADELANDGAITTAQINNAIQSSIADYEGEGFWFNEAVATFSTVASQELYTASDLSDIPNIIRILSMRVANSGAYTSYINGVENDTIEEVQDGSVKGAPIYYSRFANQIRLYPIPTSAQVIKISYTNRLPTLVNDSDTNAWTETCEELIRQAAKKRLCLDILQNDEGAARCAVLEKTAYEGIRKENRLRQPQQFLRTNVPSSRRTFNINAGW